MYESPNPQSQAIPRSECLSANFNSFMEADKELHDARENVASIRVALTDGEQRLLQAEQRWRDQVEALGKIMSSEAPKLDTTASYQGAEAQPTSMGVGGSLQRRW
jgi:hypothetical protein